MPHNDTVRNMDDSIESPSFDTKNTLSGEIREDDDAQSSGDEDEGPDWTKLPYVLYDATHKGLL